jgi:hypothetical protein
MKSAETVFKSDHSGQLMSHDPVMNKVSVLHAGDLGGGRHGRALRSPCTPFTNRTAGSTARSARFAAKRERSRFPGNAMSLRQVSYAAMPCDRAVAASIGGSDVKPATERVRATSVCDGMYQSLCDDAVDAARAN